MEAPVPYSPASPLTPNSQPLTASPWATAMETDNPQSPQHSMATHAGCIPHSTQTSLTIYCTYSTEA